MKNAGTISFVDEDWVDLFCHLLPGPCILRLNKLFGRYLFQLIIFPISNHNFSGIIHLRWRTLCIIHQQFTICKIYYFFFFSQQSLALKLGKFYKWWLWKLVNYTEDRDVKVHLSNPLPYYLLICTIMSFISPHISCIRWSFGWIPFQYRFKLIYSCCWLENFWTCSTMYGDFYCLILLWSIIDCHNMVRLKTVYSKRPIKIIRRTIEFEGDGRE